MFRHGSYSSSQFHSFLFSRLTNVIIHPNTTWSLVWLKYIITIRYNEYCFASHDCIVLFYHIKSSNATCRTSTHYSLDIAYIQYDDGPSPSYLLPSQLTFRYSYRYGHSSTAAKITNSIMGHSFNIPY